MFINELHKLTIGGDRAAEERLFRALTVSFRVIAQHRTRTEQDAEDVVQEALATVARKYRSLEVEKSFDAWAQKVLENKILDHYKTRGVEQRNTVPESATPEAAKSWEPDPALKMKLLDCLRRIAAAHQRHARILNLSHQGFRTSEICSKLGISTANFYVMLSRARLMLEICLEKGVIR